jgi:GAF domain-containing protein
MRSDSQTLRAVWEENVRLKENIEDLRAEVNRLRQIIQAFNTLQYSLDAINSETDVVALINSILVAAVEAVDCEDGSLMLLDDETGELVFVDVLGESREQLTGYRLPPSEGIAGWVAANRKPAVVPEASLDARWYSLIDDAMDFHTASLISVPLLDGERILGVIEVLNPCDGEPFEVEDLDILLLIARLASLVLVKAENVKPGSEESDSS